MLRKAFGPQIRGGESAALLKLTQSERYTAADHYDLVVALDWANFSRFEDEICLTPKSWVLCDEKHKVPESVSEITANIIQIPIAAATSAVHGEGRVNMYMLGVLGRLLGLPHDSLCELAGQKLARKPDIYREAAVECIRAGAGQPVQLHRRL